MNIQNHSIWPPPILAKRERRAGAARRCTGFVRCAFTAAIVAADCAADDVGFCVISPTGKE